MGNYILLCHGDRIEHSSFNVPAHSEIIYWGAPGYLLDADAAWTVIPQIRGNPTDLESINRLFKDLPPLAERTLEGGNFYAPDLALSGDDNLLCIFINMNTNAYALLGSGWSTRLKNLAAALRNDLLHLLCCTGANPHPSMSVLDGLQQRDPGSVIPR